MNICTLTEQEVIKFLVNSAKNLGENSPRCIVVNREQKRNSLTRIVRFALVVTANNFELIDALILDSLTFDNYLYFVGSELNRQSDNLEIDYLYFEALILAKKR